MNRTKCSLIVLTLNEERNIHELIASAEDFFSEIFVVDSGSVDSTCKVAREMGASVFRHSQVGDFMITDQRNWSLDNLPFTTEWALFMDADERLTPEFLFEVKLAIETKTYDAFMAAPKFVYKKTWLKRYMGFPNWHPRLCRISSVRFVGGVWENFEYGAKIGQIFTPYTHLVNSKGLEDWINRHLRYSKWEASSESVMQNERRAVQRAFLRILAPIRPILVIFFHLVVRRGFLDGGDVFSYARRHLIYELLILERRHDLKS